ncbi:hypothetical protein R6Q59_014739 [Mikania micrantha]
MDLEGNGDETNNHSSFGPMDWDNWFMTIAAMGLVMILGYLVYDAVKSIAAEMMQNLLMVSPLILVIVVHWLSTSNWFDIHMPGSEPEAIYRAGGSPWGITLVLALLFFLISHC